MCLISKEFNDRKRVYSAWRANIRMLQMDQWGMDTFMV